ncbi:MAG: NADH-quinone oxidoreductase subunit J [Limnothrix sp.]
MNLAEGVQIVAFIILTVMMLGSALGVVLFDNIVYSAFLLCGVFLSISGLYILLNADFVAAAQVLIYVGAINVLILFAIMLVNKQEDYSQIPRRWIRQGSTAIVCGGLFAVLGTMVLITPWKISVLSPAAVGSSVVAIAKHFFSDFLLPFELASILLLIAMIGAIVLARRDIIPEITESPEGSTGLQLPERPRELASSNLNSEQN